MGLCVCLCVITKKIFSLFFQFTIGIQYKVCAVIRMELERLSSPLIFFVICQTAIEYNIFVIFIKFKKNFTSLFKIDFTSSFNLYHHGILFAAFHNHLFCVIISMFSWKKFFVYLIFSVFSSRDHSHGIRFKSIIIVHRSFT